MEVLYWILTPRWYATDFPENKSLLSTLYLDDFFVRLKRESTSESSCESVFFFLITMHFIGLSIAWYLNLSQSEKNIQNTYKRTYKVAEKIIET